MWKEKFLIAREQGISKVSPFSGIVVSPFGVSTTFDFGTSTLKQSCPGKTNGKSPEPVRARKRQIRYVCFCITVVLFVFVATALPFLFLYPAFPSLNVPQGTGISGVAPGAYKRFV